MSKPTVIELKDFCRMAKLQCSGNKKELVYEMSDLWYHCLVLLSAHDLSPEDLIIELKRRHEKK